MTLRDRLCCPVPHDLVHGVYWEKAETTQWMGQSPGLHCDVCTLWWHAAPPFVGWVVVRVRVRVPSPHDVLHALC